MKRIAIAVVVLVAFQAAAETHQYIVSTRVPFKQLPRLVAMDAERQERDVQPFEVLNGFAAELTSEEAAELAKSRFVTSVEAAVPRHAMSLAPATLEDRNPNGQTITYGVDLVRAREVWPVTRGQAINVVVGDTGIDYRHDELKAAYAGGRDFVKNDDDPMDESEHGTHVAGTIAAADNSIGVVGIAPGVKLWAARVLDEEGKGSSVTIVKALDWIIARKAELGGNWIVNFSLGSAEPSPGERSAISRAIAVGVLVVAASGNESTATVPAPLLYPAAYTSVLSVGAVNDAKALASFSNQGPDLAVVAPGVNVLSTLPLGKGFTSTVRTQAQVLSSWTVTGSAKTGSVTGDFIYCGLGKPGDFPASVSGKIALIRRGEITFAEKAKGAKEAGATAVVIFTNDELVPSFTLINATDVDWTATYQFPLTVAISKADGEKLINSTTTLTVSIVEDNYGRLSGTSMATPHAVGVAALAWGAAPNATASAVRDAILATAKDLGPAGRDDAYGSGLVDALGAAKMLNPSAFGNPATPPPAQPPTGRRILIRGH